MSQANGSSDSELPKGREGGGFPGQRSSTATQTLLPRPDQSIDSTIPSFTAINPRSTQPSLAFRPSNLAPTLHHHNPLPSNPAKSVITNRPSDSKAFTMTSFPLVLSGRHAQAPDSQVTGSGNDSTLGQAASGAEATQKG